MITPPRAAERILEALGASSEFADGLLGDLAEEFAERAAYDGTAAARAWYWAEAWRSGPHILRNWARGLGLPGWRRLAGVMASAYALMLVTLMVPIGVLLGTMYALGVRAGRHEPSFASVSLIVALGATGGALSGYYAAWLERRAPLAAAAILAIGLGGFEFAGLLANMPATLHGPAALEWVQPWVVMAATFAGGVLRVTRSTGGFAVDE